MATTLLPLISTLVVKIPDTVYIQPLKDKASVQKNILQAIARNLNNPELEIIYAGQKNDPDMHELMVSENDTATIITVNVLEKGQDTFDFFGETTLLLKRFKYELQKSEEHIIIDRTEKVNGKPQRNLDVYIKSAGVIRKSRVPVALAHTSAA